MAHDAAIALGQLMGVGRRQRRCALPGDVLQQLVESWRLNRTMHRFFRFWAGLFMGKTGWKNMGNPWKSNMAKQCERKVTKPKKHGKVHNWLLISTNLMEHIWENNYKWRVEAGKIIGTSRKNAGL